MALVVKDRVKVTTSTTGTGTLTLGSAVTKFQDFSVVGDGNTTYYAIESGNGTDWEIGVGTYTASGTTLSRDTILESSNAGSAINLSGTSIVFCTYPAERSVNTADIGSTIQAYDADTAKYDDATANFTGTLQNGGSNVLVDTDIGSTVQGYDADTAKYDDTTANFTGTLQNGGSNVVVDTDIGSTVQGYDANTAKYNDATANFTGTLQQGGSNVLTGNQTITLSGDATGSGTTAITVTVVDDSHNHIISNVDGLQTALDAKAPLASPNFTGTATFDTNVLYVDATNNRVGINNNATDIASTQLDQLVVGSGAGNQGMVIDSGAGSQSRYGFSEGGTIKGGLQYDGTDNQIEFFVENMVTEVASINSAGKLSTTSISLNGTDVTATATELNYTDGVTSNIQTQLDSKAPLASPTFTGTATTPNLQITSGALVQDVTGQYGSLEIDNGATGGYEGYSIGGRAVFMHNNGSNTGIYNDVNNQWILFAVHNAATDIRYAGTARVETTSDGASVNGNLYFNSGYGSNALSYGVRAWVNFNGTGTVAIRASGNVSSITDNGVGFYTVNFSFTMPDIDYATGTGGQAYGNSEGMMVVAENTEDPTTTTYPVRTLDNEGAENDNPRIHLIFVR